LWPTGQHQWIALIVLVVAAFGAPLLVKLIQDWDGLEKFNTLYKVWEEEPAFSDPDTCYVRGKVLPYGHLREGYGNRVDKEFYKGLPDELRPRTPDEVASLAWVEWSSENVTTPVFPGQPYQILGSRWVCKVTLIDRRARKKLASRTFRGSDPTKGARDEHGYGDKPYPEILAYLKALPRKSD
jgi:hypothetical protein